MSRSDLQKATEYWNKEYAKEPRKLENALAYAKNLKAMGQKGQAMAVLQQAALFHGADRKLASEYGRLALEMDQVSAAKQLLEAADDPANPDWRVISARGTVLAKMGHYSEAIPFYERALTLAPDRPSVMNNLALAYTMSGEAVKAEGLLRRAVASNGATPRVRQNLALVLGLQGKYDEATQVGSVAIPPDNAASNTALVRQMVKLEPKVLPQGVIVMPPPATAVAGAQPLIPGLKPAAVDQGGATAAGWDSNVTASAWDAKVATAASKPTAPAGPVLKPSAR